MKTKNIVWLVLIFVAVLAACAPTAAAPASDVQYVSVNGTGTVTMQPDMATVWVGVQTEDASAADALATNNTMVENLKATLLDFGIEEKDMQTANFSIWPYSEYDYLTGEPGDTVYQVQNTVIVIIRDLDQLGDLLDAAVTSGANTINSVNFGVADTEAAYNQAMASAMANAESRAVLLAEAGNVELGEVQYISTFLGGTGITEPYAKDLAMSEDAGRGGGGGGVPIYGGELQVTVQVQVSYYIGK